MSLRAPEDTGDNTPIVNGHDESIYSTCAALATSVNAFLETEAPTPMLKAVQEQTRIALGVIEQALDRYRYFLSSPCCLELAVKSRTDMCQQCSLDEISLSYNGGKDCLVLLILLLCSLANHKKGALPKALHTVYIVSKHPFAEVGAFVDESVSTYKLDLVRYAMPMKEAFRKYLDEHKKIKAILVGTRRTDPHGENLTHFDPTDSGWPAFMRVHPVIDWHYAEIWAVSNTLWSHLRMKLTVVVVYSAFRDSLLPALRPRIHFPRRHD